MFAIINDSDDKYFGEAFTTLVSANDRIEELEEEFEGRSFHVNEFRESDFSYTCDICLKDGDSVYALNKKDKDDLFRCINCA